MTNSLFQNLKTDNHIILIVIVVIQIDANKPINNNQKFLSL